MDVFATVGTWVSRRFLINQIGFCCTKTLSYPVVRLPYYFGRYKHVGLGVELLGDKKSGKSPKFEFPEKTVPRVYDSKPRFLMKAPMSGGVGDTIRNTIVFPLNWIKREHSTNLMFDRLKSWRETFERTTLEQLYEEFCHRYPSS